MNNTFYLEASTINSKINAYLPIIISVCGFEKVTSKNLANVDKSVYIFKLPLMTSSYLIDLNDI